MSKRKWNEDSLSSTDTANDMLLRDLLDQYAHTREPVPVDFRKLLRLPGYPERATHLIHPYPAKLLAHIPYFFLSNQVLSQPGDTVLDPFCGSGTVLLESMLAGRSAIGMDVNPLAVLISKVKTTPLDEHALREAYWRLIRRIPTRPTSPPPNVIHLDYWFHPHIRDRLTCILQAIRGTRNALFRDFFLVCLSNCVRKVSLADPRVSVPVRLRQNQYSPGHWLYEKTKAHLERLEVIDAADEFGKTAEANLERLARLRRLCDGAVRATVLEYDVRHLSRASYDLLHHSVAPGTVQLVITSPPYAGAQKYVRTCSLSLGWLEICTADGLRRYEGATIGREHYHKADCVQCPNTGIESADDLLGEVHAVNPLRARIAGTYLEEMRKAFASIHLLLRTGGYLVLVVGNSHVSGREFRTAEYLQSTAEKGGFDTKLVLLDDIKSRGLMTKRNKTAGVITREWVLVFQKGGKA